MLAARPGHTVNVTLTPQQPGLVTFISFYISLLPRYRLGVSKQRHRKMAVAPLEDQFRAWEFVKISQEPQECAAFVPEFYSLM